MNDNAHATSKKEAQQAQMDAIATAVKRYADRTIQESVALRKHLDDDFVTRSLRDAFTQINDSRKAVDVLERRIAKLEQLLNSDRNK